MVEVDYESLPEIERKILTLLLVNPKIGLSGIRKIAHAVDVSKSTAEKYLNGLVDEGYLGVKRGAYGKPNEYWIYNNVKTLLRPILQLETGPLKYLKDANMDVVVSAPGAFYWLGFWGKGSAILLPIRLRVYVGIKDQYGYYLPKAYEHPDLSTNIYERTALVFFDRMLMELPNIKKGNEVPDIRVVYEFPPRSGLGGSAALSVAFTVAVRKFLQLRGDLKQDIITTRKGVLTDEEIKNTLKIAVGVYQTTRKYFERPHRIGTRLFVTMHGTPYKEGNVLFRKGFNKGNLPDIESLYYPEDSLPILVIYSGGEISTTLSVDRLKRLQERVGRKIVSKLRDAMSYIAEGGKNALKNKDLDKLGRLTSMNNELLNSLDQTSIELNDIVRFLKESDAYGAKALGFEKQGCVMALYAEERKNDLISEIGRSQKSARIVLEDVSLNVPGVMIEKAET